MSLRPCCQDLKDAITPEMPFDGYESFFFIDEAGRLLLYTGILPAAGDETAWFSNQVRHCPFCGAPIAKVNS